MPKFNCEICGNEISGTHTPLCSEGITCQGTSGCHRETGENICFMYVCDECRKGRKNQALLVRSFGQDLMDKVNSQLHAHKGKGGQAVCWLCGIGETCTKYTWDQCFNDPEAYGCFAQATYSSANNLSTGCAYAQRK